MGDCFYLTNQHEFSTHRWIFKGIYGKINEIKGYVPPHNASLEDSRQDTSIHKIFFYNLRTVTVKSNESNSLDNMYYKLEYKI